uniref:Uncharacterized protein n=1 Tax=Picea glauca TaxID=3330 RepID=A0A101LYK2_PICGL|nr:hypothetical protein ABT39_MTgene5914 [Picea glauca]QHR92053.1 hypothetical protein Q903MT_gene6089 [Picea sitchensis]
MANRTNSMYSERYREGLSIDYSGWNSFRWNRRRKCRGRNIYPESKHSFEAFETSARVMKREREILTNKSLEMGNQERQIIKHHRNPLTLIYWRYHSNNLLVH